MVLAPLVFVVLTALMTNEQALTSDLWPTSWHPENYVTVFEKAPLLRYIGNTVMYAGLAHAVHAAVQRAGGVRAGPDAVGAVASSRSSRCCA